VIHTVDLNSLAQLKEYYGTFLSFTGRKREALELYRESFELRQLARDFYCMEISRNSIISASRFLGKFELAFIESKQLLNRGLSQDDKNLQSLALNHMGDIYRTQDQLNRAEQAHLQAIRLCDEIQLLKRKAFSSSYLGRAHLASWNLKEAKNALQESDMLYRENDDSERLCYSNLIFWGRLLLCIGDLSGASESLETTTAFLERIGDRALAGMGHLNQALTYLAKGEPVAGLAAAQQAIQVLQRVGSWRVAEAHHLLARAYLALAAWNRTQPAESLLARVSRGAEELEKAQLVAEQAKASFIDIGLFHRVRQVESTASRVSTARERPDAEPWQCLSREELQFDFNHVGV
jgi:tetratricopeptide (TPR) repeat protein